MRKHSTKKHDTKPGSKPHRARYPELEGLHIHFLETSWRVAVPILIFTIAGIKLDQRLGTNPLWSVAGVLLSLLFATLLVYRYLKQNFPESFGGNK